MHGNAAAPQGRRPPAPTLPPSTLLPLQARQVPDKVEDLVEFLLNTEVRLLGGEQPRPHSSVASLLVLLLPCYVCWLSSS